MSKPVNSPRPYTSSRRRHQAQQTRDSVLRAAEVLFLGRGYAATTVAAIAEEADVSVETVYKAFANKPGLVRALRDRALRGAGAIPAERRSDALRAGHIDPAAVIRGWGRLSAEVAPRVAPILLLVRAAAASDSEMARLQQQVDADRLARMAENARYLSAGRHLRAGVTFAKARDVLWTYSAPELYELLVLRRGWSAQRFGRFIADSLIAALLPNPADRRAGTPAQPAGSA